MFTHASFKPHLLALIITLSAIIIPAEPTIASGIFGNILNAGNGGGGGADEVKDYDDDRRIMSRNPYYFFDTDPYEDAIVTPEDIRLRTACFKGAATQNFKANDLQSQSSLARNLGDIEGVQPSGCMPHKTTARFSPLVLNPYYYTGIFSELGPREFYQGRAYRGDRNPIHNSQRMVRPTETMQVGCAQQLMVEGTDGGADPTNPSWLRRELDNCTNQYILQQARFLRDADDDSGEYFGINTGLCQPLTLHIPPTRHDRYEYAPSEYLGIAWIKLLMDANYRHREGRAAKEPHYQEDTKVNVTRQIPIPKDNFGLITIPDLAEGGINGGAVNLQFEKILDPSHPYSPRWDFEVTDRSYSAFTSFYSNNPVTAVRCSDVVPVDLLNFRKHIFERWLPQKIAWNTACYADGSLFGCRNIIWRLLLGCKRDRPCCSTRYDQRDRWEVRFGSLVARALCGVPMRQICNYVARPLTPINTLKMRNRLIGNNFPEGVPEGYGFREYFGIHKPYMRCWDTNTECGTTSQTFDAGGETLLYDPNNILGSQYAIMGAGREGESCTIGGGAGVDGVANPDPISSWSELKLYYVRSQRKGIKCLGMHPKMFKSENAEDMMLRQTGAQWQEAVLTSPNSPNARTFSSYITRTWNYGWRGYVSDPNPAQRFPNLGKVAPISQGLDNAVKGEMLIYDSDIVMQGAPGTWRNPYVAFVKDAVNERFVNEIQNAAIAATLDRELDRVQVSAFNHGKYVDACGNTDDLGMGADYTMYKSRLPDDYDRFLDALDNVIPGKTCDDPRMSACVEPYWNNVKRYYISGDNRNGG